MRTTETTTVTVVREVCTPFGRNRDNPPRLDDFRNFVAQCEGLPGDLAVRLDRGHIGEGGRHNFTISLRYPHPPEVADEPELAEESGS